MRDIDTHLTVDPSYYYGPQEASDDPLAAGKSPWRRIEVGGRLVNDWECPHPEYTVLWSHASKQDWDRQKGVNELLIEKTNGLVGLVVWLVGCLRWRKT